MQYDGGGANAAVFGWRPPIPDSVEKKQPGLSQLISKCWDEEPKERPDFKEIHDQFTVWSDLAAKSTSSPIPRIKSVPIGMFGSGLNASV